MSSGLQLADIATNSPSTNYNTLHYTVLNGDSGAPVFFGSGFTANLYGEIYSTGGGYTFYFPWDFVQAQLGAVPSTS